MHRIVVVGGGVAGIVTATHLSRRLTRSKLAEILLVDHNLAHVWKPMLHTFAAGTANYTNENISFISHAKRNLYSLLTALRLGGKRGLLPSIARTSRSTSRVHPETGRCIQSDGHPIRARSCSVRIRSAIGRSCERFLKRFGTLGTSKRDRSRGPTVDVLARQNAVVMAEILAIEKRIHAWHCSSEESRRLEEIFGVGPIVATALVAEVGDWKTFSSGRGSAWCPNSIDRGRDLKAEPKRFGLGLDTAGAISNGTQGSPCTSACGYRRLCAAAFGGRVSF
jgi:transposase IS116/IS110/IS902 family protein